MEISRWPARQCVTSATITSKTLIKAVQKQTDDVTEATVNGEGSAPAGGRFSVFVGWPWRLRRFLHCKISRCFFPHSWRTCIILNLVEIDCTQPGVVVVVMCGRGPSSWEHGTWYVKWLLCVSKLTLAQPVLYVYFVSVASNVNMSTRQFCGALEKEFIIISVHYPEYRFAMWFGCLF